MKTDVFESMSVPKSVIKLALPTVLGMLVQIIYNIADTVYIGWLNDASQMAAVTLAAPFFTFIVAISGIFGIGGSSYISRLLGMKDYKRVKQASSFSFYVCLAFGIVTGVVGIILINPIIQVLGGVPGTSSMTYACDYTFWILLGTPSLMLSFAAGQMVRAQGASGVSMIGMVIGGVMNIILDPIMIFGFGMGVTGAAIATVLGNIFATLFYMFYIIFKSGILSINPKEFRINKPMISNVFAIGIPASLNTLLMCISNIIQNNLAMSYNEVVLASIGVVLKINMFPVFILIGLGQGIQPLIGYNYAAGNKKRMIDIMKFTCIVSTILAIIFAVVIFFGSSWFVSLIMQVPEIVELGSVYLKLIILSVPILGLLFVFTNVFQGMGKSIPAMILSISRQGFVFIPLIFFLNAVCGDIGLVISQPIADCVSVAMSIIMFIIIWNKEKSHISDKKLDTCPVETAEP